MSKFSAFMKANKKVKENEKIYSVFPLFTIAYKFCNSWL
jgi:hypothetical protein